jgi:hypothetical protein
MQRQEQSSSFELPENAAFSRIVRHAPALIQDMALTAVDIAAASYLADVRNGDDIRALVTRRGRRDYSAAGGTLVHDGLLELWRQSNRSTGGHSGGSAASQRGENEETSFESRADHRSGGNMHFVVEPIDSRDSFEGFRAMPNLASSTGFLRHESMQHTQQGASARDVADAKHVPWHVALVQSLLGVRAHAHGHAAASRTHHEGTASQHPGSWEAHAAATCKQSLSSALDNPGLSNAGSSGSEWHSTQSSVLRSAPLPGMAEAGSSSFGGQRQERPGISRSEAAKHKPSFGGDRPLGAAADPMETAVAPLLLHARINSTRALERFRNHVGIVAKVRQGFGEVLDMYEDRCALTV